MMWSTPFALIAAVAAALLSTPASAIGDHGRRSAPDPATVPQLLVRTESGVVRGVDDGDVRRWLGLPYAAPPVGGLRWRSPAAVVPWDGVRDASRHGNRCPQPGPTPGVPPIGDEDCLVLDVVAPGKATTASPRPVMVWLHGAGSGVGAGSDYDPRRLVLDGDVVVVTVTYRLGVLGALGLPGLPGSGGFALEDQQAALAWVRRNIAAFGGDPSNVTLFGESSGGMHVCAHLTSPPAAGLFDRAIVQSGSCLMELPANALFPGTPATSIWATPDEAAALGTALAADLGCPTDDPGAALDCLRALPAADLFASPLAAAFGRAAWGSAVLPVDPAQALTAGEVHPVPVMIGATRDEATYFAAGFAPPIDGDRYRGLLDEAFGDRASLVAEVYPLSEYDQPALAWAAVVTDAGWVCPTFAAARLFAPHAPTYVYVFADRNAPPLIPSPGFPLGAFHGSEVAYLFDLPGFEPAFTPRQRELATAMVGYWTAFATDGDPNAQGLPAWPRFDADRATVLSLAPDGGGIAPVDLDAQHRCGFWRAFGSLLEPTTDDGAASLGAREIGSGPCALDRPPRLHSDDAGT